MTDDGRARRRARRVRWVARLGSVLVRVLASTWRLRIINAEAHRRVQAAGQPVIFTFWHGKMLPLLWQHRKRDTAIVISEHGDGEIIARIAHSLGYRSVRGSSSRGGERALLGTVRELQEGHDVAFTPDGPRGPLESFAPGALIVAQRTGAPLVFITVDAPHAWRLRSWDRFLIPKPFARVLIAYEDPLYVEAPTTRAAAEQWPEWQQRLRDLVARYETASATGASR
ncbi:MAG: lysophospholipid acyltransferase family protein [Gemmatimonadaceae bacterium]